MVLEEKIFIIVNVFSLFLYYLPLEKGGALHLNKLEYSLLKEGSCQDCQNWQNGSGEEDL